MGALQEAFARVSFVLCGLFCLLLYFVLLAQSSLTLGCFLFLRQICSGSALKQASRPSEFLFRALKIPTRYKEQMFLHLSQD